MTARNSKVAKLIIGLSIVCALYLFYTDNNTISLSIPANLQPNYYQVTYVYDGDTFAVNMNGTIEKIRLIGVDTPETHKPNTPIQCYGPEASDFTKNLLTNTSVRLVSDPLGDNRDRYDRLLRYAYLENNIILNELLLEQGYAMPYLSFNFSKKTEFATISEKAQNSQTGIWNACAPTYKNGRWQSNELGNT